MNGVDRSELQALSAEVRGLSAEVRSLSSDTRLLTQSVNSITKVIDDHEARLRSTERWRYGFPAALLVALLSAAVTIWK